MSVCQVITFLCPAQLYFVVVVEGACGLDSISKYGSMQVVTKKHPFYSSDTYISEALITSVIQSCTVLYIKLIEPEKQVRPC